MLSSELEFCLNQAFREARTRRHEFLTVEQLLLALLDAPKVREVLSGCGAAPDELAGELRAHIEANTPRVREGDEREVQPTLGFQRVLQRAVFHVQSSGRKEVGVVNVLVAIFSEKQSHAVFLLNRQNITRLDVVHFISHGLARGSEAKGEADEAASGEGERDGGGRPGAGEVRHQPQRPGAGRAHRSADRARRWRSSAPSRSCAGGARTTRSTWARRASARRRLPRGWRA